jgi:YggT family protein
LPGGRLKRPVDPSDATANAARSFEPGGETGRMGASAMLGVLADTRDSIAGFVNVFLTVYTLLILIYVLSSWVRMPFNPWLNRVQRFLYDVCEPYLRLFRRVLPTFGPLDLSPIVAIIVLQVVRSIVVGVLS